MSKNECVNNSFSRLAMQHLVIYTTVINSQQTGGRWDDSNHNNTTGLQLKCWMRFSDKHTSDQDKTVEDEWTRQQWSTCEQSVDSVTPHVSNLHWTHKSIETRISGIRPEPADSDQIVLTRFHLELSTLPPFLISDICICIIRSN